MTDHDKDDARINRIVAALKEKWPYIDIDKTAHYDDDWRDLVRDLLEIAATES